MGRCRAERSEETPSSVRTLWRREAQGETLGNGTETILGSTDVDDSAAKLMTKLKVEMERPSHKEQGQTEPYDHVLVRAGWAA